MSPQRIQRRRTAGWRMPPGAVYVGRPTRWGNPFEVRRAGSRPADAADMWGVFLAGTLLVRYDDKRGALAEAVRRHRRMLTEHQATITVLRAELADRDLVCWCPPDQPCHADMLLEIANGGDR